MKGRMNLPRSAWIAGTALAALLVVASSASAQDPSIHFDTIGQTHYHAAEDSLDITACADFLGTPPFFSTIQGTCGPADAAFLYGTLTIHATVNELGKLTAGAFTVTGSIPDQGIADGVLLKGDALTFAVASNDELIFTFNVTGGSLSLFAYLDSDLAIRVSLNQSTVQNGFTGSFSSDFAAGAEGYIDPIPSSGGGGGGEELLRCVAPGFTGGTGTIGSRVWNDANRNAIQDVDAAGIATEAGIAALPLDLYRWDDLTSTWNHLAETVTDDSGEYVFQDLCHGTYKVEASTPDNHTASAAGRGDYTIDSNVNPSMVELDTDDGEDVTIDFGFYKTPEGPFTTFTQAEWGSKPRGNNPGMLLKNNFDFVYPASLYPQGVIIGDASALCPITGAGPYKINVTSALAIQEFLPQSHPVRALLRCQTNPGKKISFLAGQALALALNVAFSYVGVTKPGLGSLEVIRGPLAGRTVDGVLEIVNCMLSGKSGSDCGAPGLTLKQANKAARLINRNFPGGSRHRNVLALPESSGLTPSSIDADEDGED